MKKVILLMSMFLISGNVLAHEGHHHKIMGTIISVDAAHVEVNATDGQTTSASLTPETTYHQGKTVDTQTDMKVGEKIVVMCMRGSDGKMTAMDVQLPAGQVKPTK